MQKQIKKICLLFFIIQLSTQSRIKTISIGVNHKFSTTGNGITKNVDLRSISVPIRTINNQNFAEQEKLVAEFDSFKNKLVLDFPSEDPKVFRPQFGDYWYVSSKRGFLFNLLAIFSFIFIFWVYVLRLGFGECGGYKTIVRKPKKSLRHAKIRIILIGFGIFTLGVGATLYYSLLDYETNQELGESLVKRNQQQSEALKSTSQLSKGAIDKLTEINKKQLEVLYAENSFEKFQIGIFLNPLLQTYQKSIEKAKKFNSSFLTGMKSQIQLRLILIMIIVFTLCGYYIYVYRRRKVLHSLGITLGLFLMIIFAFNTMNTQFNVWSVQVEMCKETLAIFDQKNGFLFQHNNRVFNSFLTALKPEEKQILRTQMLSILVGQNAILQMMKQFIIENTNEKERIFETSESVLENYDVILNIFKNAANENTYSFDLLKDYLETFKELALVYRQLGDLSEGNQIKKWSVQANFSLCTNDLKYQYYAMWLLLLAITGIVVIAAGTYLSENVIRGIYNEEIKYVKTNKLRFDWN